MGRAARAGAGAANHVFSSGRPGARMVVRCPLVCVLDRCCLVSLCFAVIFVPYIRMDRLFCFCDCRLGWFSFNLVMSIYGVVTVVNKYLHVKGFSGHFCICKVNGSRFFDWFNMDINPSHVQNGAFFSSDPTREVALCRDLFRHSHG